MDPKKRGEMTQGLWELGHHILDLLKGGYLNVVLRKHSAKLDIVEFFYNKV